MVFELNIKDNILDLIGSTPMVYLNKFGTGLNAKLAAKLEMFNPYSVKDRPVYYMINEGERSGKIASPCVQKAGIHLQKPA